MSDAIVGFDLETALEQLDTAAREKRLSDGAVQNIRKWLKEPRYAPYAPLVARHLADGRWHELDDAFWTVIPFGTGGRRGRMYPIGSNAINDRTIGESAQGLAQYVKRQRGAEGPLRCAIAYDTRHRSPEFARLCAEIMVASGFDVFFLDPFRSTPELSFLIRHEKCACGIMVTASHNPPSDNAVKCYWSNGGQLLPPHDKGVIQCVMQTEEIERVDFDQALADGRIVLATERTDAAYRGVVREQSLGGPRDVRIIYSPLHGVGSTAVLPALEDDEFTSVELFAAHAEPNGDFPNVPNHVANPENAAVFDAMIERAREVDCDLILATDPDCDRLGCAAPVTRDPHGPWGTFTGNQIAALLADYVLQQRKTAGTLSPDHYLVKTLVTTEMVRRIGDSYGVKTYGDLLVGFKWIGGIMDDVGPDRFVFGCEESHGYLVGQYARDKDGAVASMLMAELAAGVKAVGQTIHGKLDSLFWQHGYHAERLLNVKMEGSEGMGRMKALMSRFRSDPPTQLGRISVSRVRDYLNRTSTSLGSTTSERLEGPVGDMVFLDLAETGNYVAVRPSGTEPKVKFYMFTYVAAEMLADLETTKHEMAQRLAALEDDLRHFADTV